MIEFERFLNHLTYHTNHPDRDQRHIYRLMIIPESDEPLKHAYFHDQVSACHVDTVSTISVRIFVHKVLRGSRIPLALL